MRKQSVFKLIMATSLILGLSITNVLAGSIKDQTKQRLSGIDRFQTAVAISQQGWQSSNAVVLADANNFPDALIGGPLAYQKNAPILLTDKNNLSETSLAEIKRLKAKDIYIIGDISPNIDNYLTSNGYNVKSINGSDKFKTAVNVGQEVINLKPTDTIFLAYAYDFPDALSASTFAAENGYPILFTDKDSLNTDTQNAINKWGMKNVFVLGGTGVISADVETNLKTLGLNTKRLSGNNRYDTAEQIIKYFDKNTYNGLILASGLDFPDALTGSVLAAKENAPIMIYNETSMSQDSYDYAKSKSTNLYILGGQGVIPEQDIYSLQAHNTSSTIDWDMTNKIRPYTLQTSPYNTKGEKAPLFDDYLLKIVNGSITSDGAISEIKAMSWSEIPVEKFISDTPVETHIMRCVFFKCELSSNVPGEISREIAANKIPSTSYKQPVIYYDKNTGKDTYYALCVDFYYDTK